MAVVSLCIWSVSAAVSSRIHSMFSNFPVVTIEAEPCKNLCLTGICTASTRQSLTNFAKFRIRLHWRRQLQPTVEGDFSLRVDQIVLIPVRELVVVRYFEVVWRTTKHDSLSDVLAEIEWSSMSLYPYQSSSDGRCSEVIGSNNPTYDVLNRVTSTILCNVIMSD